SVCAAASASSLLSLFRSCCLPPLLHLPFFLAAPPLPSFLCLSLLSSLFPPLFSSSTYSPFSLSFPFIPLSLSVTPIDIISCLSLSLSLSLSFSLSPLTEGLSVWRHQR